MIIGIKGVNTFRKRDGRGRLLFFGATTELAKLTAAPGHVTLHLWPSTHYPVPLRQAGVIPLWQPLEKLLQRLPCLLRKVTHFIFDKSALQWPTLYAEVERYAVAKRRTILTIEARPQRFSSLRVDTQFFIDPHLSLCYPPSVGTSYVWLCNSKESRLYHAHHMWSFPTIFRAPHNFIAGWLRAGLVPVALSERLASAWYFYDTTASFVGVSSAIDA